MSVEYYRAVLVVRKVMFMLCFNWEKNASSAVVEVGAMESFCLMARCF